MRLDPNEQQTNDPNVTVANETAEDATTPTYDLLNPATTGDAQNQAKKQDPGTDTDRENS